MSGIAGIGTQVPLAYLSTAGSSDRGGQAAGAGKIGGGGGGGSGADTTATVVNADGSTTTTVTNAAGTILSVTTTPAPEPRRGGIGRQAGGGLSISA